MPLTTLTDIQSPVGAIKTAMLTLAQFQSLVGTGWVLADGTSCAGSTYATITGNTVTPDLRGQVLRGKNNGRNDGSQNPDGDLALGIAQSHATAKNGLSVVDPGHTHSIIANATNGNTGNTAIYSVAAAATITNTNGIQPTVTGVSMGSGDNETRMRNVTVNHFIRIN